MNRITNGLALLLAASQAQAADVESGRRLAQQRCAACHIVTSSPRNDLVADAPPFLAIGRKYGFATRWDLPSHSRTRLFFRAEMGPTLGA
jgi:mono/diheme cytochrome c family protein